MNDFHSGSPPPVGTDATCVRIVGSRGVFVISVRAVLSAHCRPEWRDRVVWLSVLNATLEPVFGVQVNGRSW
jgi:hypothetical protein